MRGKAAPVTHHAGRPAEIRFNLLGRDKAIMDAAVTAYFVLLELMSRISCSR